MGDRFGGVMFDVQQYRKGETVFVPADNARAIQREKLLHTISVLITLVEEIDENELRGNPRIMNCSNPQHDRYRTRKSDCQECFAEEAASLSSSLANLTDKPGAVLCECGCGRTWGLCAYGEKGKR